jgi:hypothetical protein
MVAFGRRLHSTGGPTTKGAVGVSKAWTTGVGIATTKASSSVVAEDLLVAGSTGLRRGPE